MARHLDQQTPHAALIEVARDFHGRGWMAGTAGNLSHRAEDGSFWITASSLPKGALEITDFIQIDIDGGEVLTRLAPQAEPSAETAIHRSIYKLFPTARACFHIHTVDACIATARVERNATGMRLPPLEMIKGLGIWEQEPEVSLPLFDNTLDVGVIAAGIEERFSQTPPQVPALMIRDHGVTVWGDSLQQAYNRVEIVEFIMSYLARGG